MHTFLRVVLHKEENPSKADKAKAIELIGGQTDTLKYYSILFARRPKLAGYRK